MRKTKRTSEPSAEPKSAAKSMSSDTADASPQRTPARPPVRRAPPRPDDADAFIPDPGEGPALAPDDLAEVLAEDYVAAATSGEDVIDEDLEAVVPDEVGGPFVETSADEEIADDVDLSNPPDATREPLPRAVSGLTRRPRNS